MNKFEIQNEQYATPYHYIPLIKYKDNKIVGVCKTQHLGWGCKYIARIKYLMEKIQSDNKKSVLEVGCGDGRICNTFARFGTFEKIKGIDLSEDAIVWAKAYSSKLRNVSFEAKDVSLENEKWDAIVCSEVLEHISDKEIPLFLQNVSKCLKKDGYLYVTVPSINLPLEEKHYRHYTIDVFNELIKKSGAGLNIIDYKYIIPKRGILYKLVQKPFYNSCWKFTFFDKFEWWLLWRNGLEESEKNGENLYIKLRKVENDMA